MTDVDSEFVAMVIFDDSNSSSRRGWRWKKPKNTIETAIVSLDLDSTIHNLWLKKPSFSYYYILKLKISDLRADLPIDEDETEEKQKEETTAKKIKIDKISDIVNSLSIYHNLEDFQNPTVIQNALDTFQNFFELIGEDDDRIFWLQFRGFDLTGQREYNYYLPFVRVYPDFIVHSLVEAVGEGHKRNKLQTEKQSTITSFASSIPIAVARLVVDYLFKMKWS